MGWQATPYTLPLLIAALVSFGLSAYVVVRAYALRRYDGGSRRLIAPFLGVSLSAGWWALVYALQLSATTLSSTLWWNQAVWLGVAAMMVAWPAFVLAYTGRHRWLAPSRFVWIVVVPATLLLVTWTRGLTELVYLDPQLVDAGSFLVLGFEPGPVLLVAIAYSYTVNLAAFALLAWRAATSNAVIRQQATLLLVAGIVPMAVGIAGMSGIGPTYVDLTPMAFAVTSVLVAWALFGYRLLDLSPTARERVFSDLADGVVVVSGEGQVVDANDTALAVFDGLAVGRQLADAFADHPRIVAAVTDDRDGVTVGVECDGESRTFEVSTLSIERAGLGGTVLLVRDVTDRETLQRRYRTLIEKSPNVIAVVRHGTFHYVSPSVERLLGYDPDRLVGTDALAVVHPDDESHVQGTVETALETGNQQQVEHRVSRADGTWRRFETHVEPAVEGTAEVVFTGTDVTEQRLYEQRLQVLNRVLRHDLKNDVNVITGYADLLREHVPEGEPTTYLDAIDRKAEALTHLSEQAREIDVALHSEERRTTVDLAELVPSVADSLDETFGDVSVTVDVPDEAPVLADTLLESTVRNVLENAVVHHDGSPSIDVRVEAWAEGYEVVVADDGPGIPAVEREVITAGRETPLEHASGLGLWLVHWIVSNSGGDLDIEENHPRGTVVRIRLPAA